MNNPYKAVSIFRVEYQHINDETGEKHVSMIIIGFSRSGIARAFDGFSDRIIGKAGGYGYDKEGAALADALENEYGISPFNGAAGVSAVIEHAKEEGVYVKTLSELIWNC